MSTSYVPSFIKIYQAVLEKKLKMWKFTDDEGRTDRQTDRVITIGHPPCGGALNFSSNRNVLPQEINMWNMKARSLLVQKIWPRLSFFSKVGQSHGQGHEVTNFGIDRKVLSQWIHLCNIKYPSPFVKKLWSRLSLLWTDGRTDRQDDSYIPPKWNSWIYINLVEY